MIFGLLFWVMKVMKGAGWGDLILNEEREMRVMRKAVLTGSLLLLIPACSFDFLHIRALM